MSQTTILVADDDAPTRLMLKGMLHELGYLCLTAANGREAVDLVQKNDVALAILDVAMPEMNGIEALKEIRRRNPDVAILMITGQFDLDPLLEAFGQHSVFDYILKPFTLEGIRNTVLQVLYKREIGRIPAVVPKELDERILTMEREYLHRTSDFRESQIRYRNMVEQSRDMILVALDGYVQYANPRAVALSGYAAEELFRIPILCMVHPGDHSTVLEFYRRHENREQIDQLISFRVLRKDRTWFWVEMNAMETLWEGKRAIVGILRDITERVQAEEALRTKELAIASSPNAVFFADLEGKITHVNRAFLKILGFQSEVEVLGCLIQGLIHVPDVDSNRLLEQTALARGGDLQEIKVRRKDGSLRDMQSSIILIRDDAERPLCFMGSFSDITDQKRLAELMLRSEKLTSLGQLSAGLAHELKNPLAVISSCSQFCLDNMELERSLKENLQVIYRNSRRANRLIEELLNFARPSRLLKTEVDINDLILRTIEMVSLEMHSYKTSFIKDLQSDLPSISADEEKLRQVFLNIIMNALQAVGGKGVVTIRSRYNERRRRVHVDIRDDGPGIPLDYRHRIFDPFFSTKDRGTGLGLSICHSIVQEHDGEILVECPETGGACLSIHLPLGAFPPEQV